MIGAEPCRSGTGRKAHRADVVAGPHPPACRTACRDGRGRRAAAGAGEPRGASAQGRAGARGQGGGHGEQRADAAFDRRTAPQREIAAIASTRGRATACRAGAAGGEPDHSDSRHAGSSSGARDPEHLRPIPGAGRPAAGIAASGPRKDGGREHGAADAERISASYSSVAGRAAGAAARQLAQPTS